MFIFSETDSQKMRASFRRMFGETKKILIPKSLPMRRDYYNHFVNARFSMGYVDGLFSGYREERCRNGEIKKSPAG